MLLRTHLRSRCSLCGLDTLELPTVCVYSDLLAREENLKVPVLCQSVALKLAGV